MLVTNTDRLTLILSLPIRYRTLALLSQYKRLRKTSCYSQIERGTRLVQPVFHFVPCTVPITRSLRDFVGQKKKISHNRDIPPLLFSLSSARVMRLEQIMLFATFISASRNVRSGLAIGGTNDCTNVITFFFSFVCLFSADGAKNDSCNVYCCMVDVNFIFVVKSVLFDDVARNVCLKIGISGVQRIFFLHTYTSRGQRWVKIWVK